MLSLAHPETHVVEESRATPQGGMTVVYIYSFLQESAFLSKTNSWVYVGNSSTPCIYSITDSFTYYL